VKAARWFGDGLAVARGLALAAAAGLGGCGDPEESFGLGTHRAGLVLGSARWEQPLSTLPPSRMGHALIYDSARAVTLAVGGRPVSDTGSSSADTWAWDGSAWTELPASFPPRGFIQGTFDSARQVSVIYGGIDQSPSSAYFAETQERSTGTWSNRSGTPGARSSSGLAYDAGRGVTVLFGGFDGAWRNDVRRLRLQRQRHLSRRHVDMGRQRLDAARPAQRAERSRQRRGRLRSGDAARVSVRRRRRRQ
jgi:hypothetical protein